MGTGVAEVVGTVTDPRCFKVHRLMCTELLKLVDRISSIFPEIEAARPRCSSGIEALCLLNRAIEKARQLLLQCSESSKLYLAMTGEAIVARCQKSKTLFEQSLHQIQNMVPVALAIKISQLFEDLRGAIFILEPYDEEAGKIIQEMLHRVDSSSDSAETSEIQSFQLAASRLQITSAKAVVIERRSIKKLLAKVDETNPTKKYILTYFLHLLKKYGNSITRQQTDRASALRQGAFAYENFDNGSIDNQPAEVEPSARHSLYEFQSCTFIRAVPPEEFKCPISSRLMYDPVVIASGQTYERVWIQKWFDEGQDTCPKTGMKLTHLSLTPNVTMKDLISRWCIKNGITISNPSVHPEALQSWETSSTLTSIASFGSSMNDLHLQMDLSNVSLGSVDASNCSESSHANAADGLHLNQTNDHSDRCQSYSTVEETDSEYLSKLSELPWESQCKVVENVKNQLKFHDQECYSMSSENFIEPLIIFLRAARERDDVKAQRDGFQLMSVFVRKSRDGVSYLREEGYDMLASFFDSEVTKEVLDILETLSGHRYCGPKLKASGALAAIMRLLDFQIRDFQEQALNILYNLSSSCDIFSKHLSSECIPKLVPLFKDGNLSGYCLSIIENLCTYEEARVSVVQTNGCIASIAEALETGTCADQEHAVAILLSLCSQRDEYCELVMDEGVIPALVDISINGTDKGKINALELLRLLKDISRHNSNEQEQHESDVNVTRDSSYQTSEKKSSRASGFFGRKMSMFSKTSKKK